MIKKIFEKNWAVFALYTIIFAIIFIPYIKGIGNFWDWGWPVTNEDISNIFWNSSYSWTDFNLGRPLVYAADYWGRLVLASLELLPLRSETSIYLLLTAISTISSYLLYLIVRKRSGIFLSLIIGILAIINPAFLYKLVSGHLDYLISYPIFIGLIYFIFCKFKKDLKSYIVLAILVALVGFQIQYFVFALLFLILYFIFKKEQFSIKYSIISATIAISINLPWLSNFLMGANKVSSISGRASSVSFEGAMSAKIQNILVLAFSDATTIKYYFSKPEFLYFGVISLIILTIVAIFITKHKTRNSSDELIMSTMWLILALLSTGFFHAIKVVPFSTLSPIFREVGHFAPVAVLFGLLIIGYSKIKKRAFYLGLLAYLLIFGAINVYTVATKLPKTDYSKAREKFQNYITFWDENQSISRVLTYPFFGQYSYFDQSKDDVRGRLIENSGTDSVVDNSGIESISNYIQPQELKDSEQYKIVTTYDVDNLKDKNVKYIFDFSEIWESNFERYAGSEVYDNDLSLIKNDPDFFNKLMEKNPGQIVEVEENIFEILDTKDRIYGENVTFEKISPVKYKINISNLKESTDLTFLESFHSGWKLCQHNTQCFLFDESHREVFGYANQWTVDSDSIINNLNKDHYSKNEDGSIDVDLILYFKPQTYQNIGIVLAILTLIGSAGYLIVLKLKR